ncbi:Asp-tRNA(Asn)/Glu-tRNA(Gln) amidotransferase subunit GatA [Candidatus Peregrinibacteria bacterium]|nr:Asp-tRNA(Asn)/Glu-tRNA(Gln) amidotransferase subunit GatA [Candidatus Peregrinibacteria bacterium]
MTIQEALEKLRSKELSVTELVQAYLKRIETLEPKLNAYLTITKDFALEKARELDKKGDFGAPLAGIPMNLKDVVCTQGIRTTACSKILENFVPPYDAVVWQRLKKADCVLLGKTGTDEFTMGSSNENSAFGPVRNPWNREYVPGGSSGGPAASVIADETIFSIGTDTGGSIRQPASLCSCVGLKVTYGRVSRWGVIPYASSLDTIGPLTKTVEDAAIVLSVIAGQSEEDSTTPAVPVPDYAKCLRKSLKGKTVGIPEEFFKKGVEPETEKAVRDGIEVLKKLGAKVEKLSMPLVKYSIPTYYFIAKSEASTNLARYDGIRFGHATDKPIEELEDLYAKSRAEGFGEEVKRAIMLGTYALSAGYYDAYYLKAAKVRALMKQEYEKAFQTCDALITPTSPFPAFGIGEKMDDPIAMYSADTLTTSINLAGVCAMSVPAGFSKNGLPIGMQIIGPQFGEEKVLHVGYAFEQATEWHKKRPKLN